MVKVMRSFVVGPLAPYVTRERVGDVLAAIVKLPKAGMTLVVAMRSASLGKLPTASCSSPSASTAPPMPLGVVGISTIGNVRCHATRSLFA